MSRWAAPLLELLTAWAMIPVAWAARLLFGSPERLTIVGWWGSETVGDVAILGQLLRECEQVAPSAEIVLVSFRPEITRVTLDELGRPDVRLLPVGPASGRAAVLSRLLIYGGGPLMESPRMLVWAVRTLLARAAGTRVLLYACGIGPIRSGRVELAVKTILRLSDHLILRDRSSLEWAYEVLGPGKGVVSVDPALHYASGTRRKGHPRREDQLALALRFPPSSYLDGADTNESADRLLDVVAEAVNEVMKERALVLVGCVMHTGFEESDDHRVYERLAPRLDRPDRLRVPPGRHTVDQVRREIEVSRALLTLRFHGMILALATETPFVAIDCVRPSGKITATAATFDRTDSVLPWDDMEGRVLAERLRRAMAEPPRAVPDLAEAREIRLRLLRAAMRR